jgi:hypothetical protein
MDVAKGSSSRHKAMRSGVAKYNKRPVLAGLVVVLTALAGWTFAAVFGRGFTPAPAAEVPTYGFVQSVRLPIRARSINELSSFEVEMNGADDFARVYVNNYLVISTENPNSILLFTPESDPQQQMMTRLAVKRNIPLPGRKDVVGLLRKGVNTIVFENENSIFGTCSAAIVLFANGQRLERFPVRVPIGLYPERASAFPSAIELFERTRAAPSATDILCARRVFVFELS